MAPPLDPNTERKMTMPDEAMSRAAMAGSALEAIDDAIAVLDKAAFSGTREQVSKAFEAVDTIRSMAETLWDAKDGCPPLLRTEHAVHGVRAIAVSAPRTVPFYEGFLVTVTLLNEQGTPSPPMSMTLLDEPALRPVGGKPRVASCGPIDPYETACLSIECQARGLEGTFLARLALHALPGERAALTIDVPIQIGFGPTELKRILRAAADKRKEEGSGCPA